MRTRWMTPLLLVTLLTPGSERVKARKCEGAEPADAAAFWASRQAGASSVPPFVRGASDPAAPYRWQPMGPQPIATQGGLGNTGKVTAIAVSPADSKVVLAGTSGGGIWRTADGGLSFVPVTDDQSDLTVGAIAFAPSDPRIVYAGLGDDHLGTGVLQSNDAGVSWRLVTSPPFPARSASHKIAVDAHDPRVVWLLQSRVLNSSGVKVLSGALLLSEDGGASWRSTFDGIVSDFVLAPDGSVVMGAVRGKVFGTGGIYRSTDRGANWSHVYSGPADQDSPPFYALATGPSGNVYAAAIEDVNDETTYQLLQSSDGVHWGVRSRLPEDFRDNLMFYLAVDPADERTMYYGAVGSHRSTDGGQTWSAVPTHPDQRSIAFDADRRIWIGNDGGLFRSTDQGVHFDSFASMLPVVEFYSVAAHPTDPAILFAGAQDNGMQRRTGDRLDWPELLGGDGGATLFDRADPSRVLCELFGPYLVRMSNNGNGTSEQVATASTFAIGGSVPRVAFIPPMAQGPDGTVWFGTWQIFSSPDFGTTWSAGSADLTAGGKDVLTAIGTADGDPQVVYAGSASGHLMVTTDHAASWTDVTPAANRNITSIAVSRTSAGTAYVAFAGYPAPHVVTTSNFGAAWTDASAGLPDVPVNVVYIDKQHPTTLYAGTDVGVFRSDTAGRDWFFFSEGMPSVVVTSFTTSADGRLIAGTYGRGAYVLQESPPAGPRRRAVSH